MREPQTEKRVPIVKFEDHLPSLFHSVRQTHPTNTPTQVLCEQVLQGQCIPFLFVDMCSTIGEPLPPPRVLGKFLIVLTSTKRFSSEYKRVFSDRMKNYIPATSLAPSPLLEVYWRRMVVDEGHLACGKSNSISFGGKCWSKFRWVITGTPVSEIEGRNVLGSLLGLLQYLKVDCLFPQLGGDNVWKDEVGSGWGKGHSVSYLKVVRLLSEVMISHDKLMILDNLPVEVRTIVEMSEGEKNAYNGLVNVVRSNILLTEKLVGRTSGRQDSILNPSQSKHATMVATNVRLACCGGTQLLPTLTQKNWDETLQFIEELPVTKVKGGRAKVEKVEAFLSKVTTGEVQDCGICGRGFQMLLLMPCVHFLCADCVEDYSEQGEAAVAMLVGSLAMLGGAETLVRRCRRYCRCRHCRSSNSHFVP